MARQQDACWLCGTRLASDDEPRVTLRAIPRATPAAIAAAVGPIAEAAAQASSDADRWVDEGGSFDYEVTGLAPAAAGNR
jgi:hypothetical protein